MQRCRECGRMESHACIRPGFVTCHWVEPDLCSACAPDAADGWVHPPRVVTDAIAEGRMPDWLDPPDEVLAAIDMVAYRDALAGDFA